jgi:hypothetical protein
MKTKLQQSWFRGTEDQVVDVGPHLRITAKGNVTVLFVREMPIRQLQRSDVMSLRLELAALESTSVVSQAQVAHSGLVPKATFQRDCAAFLKGGEQAMLRRAQRGTKACKPTLSILAQFHALHQQKRHPAQIAVALGISIKRVKGLLVNQCLTPQIVQLPLISPTDETRSCAALELLAAQGSSSSATAAIDLPTIAAVATGSNEQVPPTLAVVATGSDEQVPPTIAAVATGSDEQVPPTIVAVATGSDEQVPTTEPQTPASPALPSDPAQERGQVLDASEVAARRQLEQTQARLGQLQEQSALFAPVEHARYAGVLLALSLLSTTGLLKHVRGTLPALKKGYYGVRSIVTTLLAMAVLRCKRPEQLKGFDPTGLGVVLGLERAPEIKTLRCKYKELAKDEPAVRELMQKMATEHVERVKEAVAFLYIDGHVRPYFGDKTLSKAHITAMRIALPATTDYWVGDAHGEPLLVVTTEGNAAMTQTLPSLLKEVRQVVGAQAKPTIVFDRGGFCGKLFGDIVKDGFDFITYRKGNYEAFATENALEVTIRRDGKERCVKAWDSRVELKEYGSIRCVAVLRSDGKQTHVLTSREDLSIREVLERMFSRWQQENFFKYLGEEFAFDALWTYGADQANSERTVANPKRNALSEQIATLRRQIAEHQKTIGVRVLALVEGEGAARKKPLREAGIDPVAEIAKLEEQVKELKERRKALPERVRVATLRANGEVVELARAPMLLSDIIKMTAYHIETMLLTMVAPHLKRAHEEGRAFLADVMQLDGRLTPEADCLEVRLKSPSAPRYRRALEGLCEQLNTKDVTFPETPLRLHFSVAPPWEGQPEVRFP